MTFEDLARANESIATMGITKKDKKTGQETTKQYAEVNQRIKAFRMLIPNGSIETELISLVDGICVFRALVKDDEGKVLGTGTAYEKEGSTFINQTSYIENCETSAVGRALAMCGIGIDLSIASYEEVANATVQQDNKDKNKNEAKMPSRDVMMQVAIKHYPEGSKNHAALLASFEIESLDKASDMQLLALYNKFGGK